MNTVMVAAQKGGGGKTTLAIHLAVAASAGTRTILVDADPQRSVRGWAEIRGDKDPEVFDVTLARLPDLLGAAEQNGIELAIVDTPGHSSIDTAQALRRASFILVPVRPTALDLMALEATARAIRAAGRPAAAVLSACPSRAKENNEAVGILSEMGLAAAPVRIAQRVAYSRTLASGSSVSEDSSDASARGEVDALWKWLQASMLASYQASTVA